MAPEPKKDYRIDYYTFHMIWIVFFTLITVIDRFTCNVWPLWVDSPGPIIEGNFSVSCFSSIAWISGRVLIVSSSYIFLFECRVFWNWFAELKFINKYINIGDIQQANDRLHYLTGWLFIGVPVMLHVWVIVFAIIFPQNHFKIYHSWMRPDDPITGRSIPFYENNFLSLGLNDIYRLCSTTLSFCILIPYSLISYFRDRNWSFAQWIHLIGGAIYMIDLLRMKSHPHCWYFNIPFLIWWFGDRMYGIFCYRRTIANLVGKIHLDEKYIILFLRIPQNLQNLHSIGDIFYFNILDCGFDRAHPFTVFQNHNHKNKMISHKKELIPSWTGHKFAIYSKKTKSENEKSINSITEYIVSRQSTKIENSKSCSNYIESSQPTLLNIQSHIDEEEEEEEYSDDDRINKLFDDNCDWNIGICMQIIPDHENCYYRKTWTKQIFDTNYKLFAGLRSWGPYRSEYRLLICDELSTEEYPLTPLVLIGTGAGCALLIDYYNYICSNNMKLNKRVEFYFSTKSISMFQWFTDITCKKNIDNMHVNAHITSHNNMFIKKKQSDKSCDKNKTDTDEKTRDCKIGRLCLNEILQLASKDTHVYFCGHPNVQQIAQNICQKLSLKFHAGHSFS